MYKRQVLGAAVLTIAPELIRSLMEYRMLIYGVIMVVRMLVRPQGLLGKVNLGQIREREVDGQHSGKGGCTKNDACIKG